MDTGSLVVDTLRARGLAFVPGLAALQVAYLNANLMARRVYRDAHIPETARKRGDNPMHRINCVDSECVCCKLADALLAPYLFERALGLTDAVAAYLGRDPPVLYSANAFWTRPGAGIRPDIQEPHRDLDDERFVVLFVYLTDVHRIEDGPHELHGPDGQVRKVYGRAGTMFLADTSHLHRGLKPTSGERGIVWFRWGISDRPAANVWDKNEPIPAADLGDRYPADPRLRESIKLLVTP